MKIHFGHRVEKIRPLVQNYAIKNGIKSLSKYMYYLFQSSASIVEFLATPAKIKYPMTSSLTLTCTLNDDLVTPAPGNGIVGRAADPTSDDVIKHITAMTISRAGIPIATVSLFTPAHTEPGLDLSNLHVSGDVSAGHQGHLELVWEFPNSNQTGEFSCEVGGVTEAGHNVHLTDTVVVSTAQVNLDDILSEIHDLKILVHGQQKTIADQQKEILAEKSKNDNQEKEILAEKSENYKQQQELATLRQELANVAHVETGIISCGASGSWHDGHYFSNYTGLNMRVGDITKSVSQSFTMPYSKPPVVFLSIVKYSPEGKVEDDYATAIEHVDSSGFRMRCGIFYSDNPVEYMYVSWISITG